MAEKEIIITYEALFELLRRERDRLDIQKLSETYYDDVIDYLKEKVMLLNKLQPDKESEKEKVQTQIENIKKIVTQLYDRREKKIIDIAMNKSRLNNDEIDTSILLNDEKELLEKLVNILKETRKHVLNRIVSSEPSQEQFTIPKKEEKEPIKESQPKQDITKIKFLHPVPAFLGKNLESFGPFLENEIVELPIELAKILIDKGRAIKQ